MNSLGICRTQTMNRHQLALFLFSTFLILFFLVGCTHTIAISNQLEVASLQKERIPKHALVFMDKSFEKKIVTVASGSIGDKFEINVGNSIKSNAIFVMKKYFKVVSFTNTPPSNNDQYDYLVRLNFQDFNSVLGLWTWSEHKIFLKIGYIFSDSSGNELFAVNSVSSGKANAKGVLTSISPMYGHIKYREAIGKAFDNALKASLDQFVARLNYYFKE